MLDKYYNLKVDNSNLFGVNRIVEVGQHGLETGSDGREHFATLYHIKNGIATGALKALLEKVDDKKLTEAARNDGQDINAWPRVKYTDKNVTYTKYKLEWLMEYVERKYNLRNNIKIDNSYKLEVIKNHISNPIKELINDTKTFYTDSEIDYLNSIIRIIEKSYEDFSLLSKYLFLPIFEITCKKLENAGLIKDIGDTINSKISSLAKIKDIRSLDKFIETEKTLLNYKSRRNDLTHNKLENKHDFLNSANEIEVIIKFINEVIEILYLKK